MRVSLFFLYGALRYPPTFVNEISDGNTLLARTETGNDIFFRSSKVDGGLSGDS
jgi:hypothetical protein